VQHRRYVRLAQQNLVVRAAFDDLHDAERGVSVGHVALPHEAHAKPADLDDGRLVGRSVRIPHFDFADGESREAVLGVVVEVAFFTARASHRHGEHDDFVLQLHRHVVGDRGRVFSGKVEGRAVGKNAAPGAQLHFAERQGRTIELRVDEAPAMSEKRPRAAFDVPFPVAVVLLEMLGLKEKAFRPDDFIVPWHVSVPTLESRSLQTDLNFVPVEPDFHARRLVRINERRGAPLRALHVTKCGDHADVPRVTLEILQRLTVVAGRERPLVARNEVRAEDFLVTFVDGKEVG
jgi:hypothetical protein